MKITKHLILGISLSLLFNCSKSNNEDQVNEDPLSIENDQINDNPVLIEKDLLKMTGSGDHWLSYEDGRINKVWSRTTTFRSQMVYNSNGTMSREYRVGTGDGNSDNENFEWEIPVSENYIENIYENGKLVEIIRHDSGSSWKLVEYNYQEDLVIEKRLYYGSDNYVDIYIRYIYNDQNEITTIIWDESPGGGSSHTLQVTFDDKVNPYYKIWKDTKLTFWNLQDAPARYNIDFYPHNIINLKEGANDTWYDAYYTYDEDNLPITMRVNDRNSSGDEFYFEYQ